MRFTISLAVSILCMCVYVVWTQSMFCALHEPFEEVKLKSNPGQLCKDSIIAMNTNNTRTSNASRAINHHANENRIFEYNVRIHLYICMCNRWGKN